MGDVKESVPPVRRSAPTLETAAGAIGARIRQARESAGVSQKELGRAAHLSPSYVSLLEAGKRTPSEQTLSVIAEHVGTTSDWLRYGAEAPSDLRVRLAVDYARLDLSSGAPERGRERLLSLDLESTTDAVRVQAELALAHAHEMCGDLESAIVLLEEVLARARAAGSRLDAAAAATPLVVYSVQSGDLVRAVELGEAQMRELEDEGLAGVDEHLRLGSSLLWAYAERGDLHFAALRAEGLIRQAESLGTPRGRGSVYWNAAIVADRRGDYTTAKRYTERALALLGEYCDARDLPRLRLNYAHVLLRCDPPEVAVAEEQLDQVEPLLAVAGSVTDLTVLDVERSRVHLLRGEARRAEELARRAIDRLGDDPRLEACAARLAIGDALYAHEGMQAGAVEAFVWAAEQFEVMSAPREAAAAWRRLADRLREGGRHSEAMDAFDRALRAVGFACELDVRRVPRPRLPR